MRLAKTITFMVIGILVLVFVPTAIIMYFGMTTGEIPEEGLLIGTIVGVSVLSALLVPAFLALRWLRDRKIRNHGILSKAKILTAKRTSLRINGCPVFELDLEVHPPYDQSFTTTVDYCARYPEWEKLMPGTKIQVFWLPGTTDVVVAGETD
jgi:hypothetical protein